MFAACCGIPAQGVEHDVVPGLPEEQAPKPAKDTPEEKPAADGGEKAEGIVEAVMEAVQHAAEKVAEIAATVQETVVEKVAEAKEQISATMGAATAALTSTMSVAFQAGKEEKTVDFKSRNLGFECGHSGGCCCGSSSPAKVVVVKVAPRQQAEELGVKKGWVVKSVNGTEVTGLEQARQLFAEAAAKLPEVA